MEFLDVGMFEYPFEMNVPEWLPASTRIQQKNDGGCIWYEVRAQFVPVH